MNEQVIQGEAGESSLSPEITQQKEAEYQERAAKKGWTPQENWRGAPEDWVPAREFLGRQKLFDKIHDLKGDLYKQRTKFESDMSNINTYIAQMQKQAYDQAMKDLKVQRRQAVADGNAEAIEQIEETMDTLKENQPQAPKTQPQQAGPTPEFEAWHAKNEWFQKEPELTQDAIEIGIGHAQANPGISQAQLLEYVEKRVKKMHPEKFEQPKSESRQSAPDVEGGSDVRPSNSTSRRSKKLTVSDLNDQEKSVMKTLIARNVLKAKADKNKVSQEQQYLNDIAEAKGL